MATIVTRAGKGLPLSNTELDANFINLNTGKSELNSPVFTGYPTLPSTTLFKNGGGSKGGQLQLEKPATGSTLSGDVILDSYANLVRIFEVGVGINRGVSLDLTKALPNASSKLFHQGFKPVKADVGLGNVDDTSDESKPVSTAQAAANALKINKIAAMLTNIDDKTLANGFYEYAIGIGGTIPPGNYGTLLVSTRDGGVGGAQTWVTQLAFSTVGVVWKRFSTNGAAWSVWQMQFGQNNILGTVSQAAGVPTGAVIERGSNGNGEYVRFADGTQICTSTALITTAAGIQELTWTFPAVFVNSNNLVAMVLETGSMSDPRQYTTQNRYLGNTATSHTVIVYTLAVLGAKASAIGRWF